MSYTFSERFNAAFKAFKEPSKGPSFHFEECSFDGFNNDGSLPFTFKNKDDGTVELVSIRFVGWKCFGPLQK